MRLIDADELIYRLMEIVREMQYEDVDDEETAVSAYLDSILRVKCMPTIYPDSDHIRHGHWIVSNKSSWSKCSVCKRHFLYVWDYDNADEYCRHCGAKMDEPLEALDDGE